MFVHENRFKYAVKELCRVLKVSRSGYYRWVAAGCPERRARDAVTLAVIRQIERDNDSNYGVRRVHRSLNNEHGIRCGYGKTARIMRENGIKAKIKCKYKPQTTKADKKEQAYPNLLNQQFGEKEKNRVWLTDITYVRVNGTWNYLAAVLDLGRRKIVGWAVGANPTAELACRALGSAIRRERPPKGLIHHSDRGCQYTSKAYRELLEYNKMAGSMSRVGTPYDNAPMESFFQTLKTECLYKHTFGSIEQLERILRSWIDDYYNRRRLHSALGYKSPLSYEISRNHPFPLSA
jgi:transposase InsO family protein